MKSAGFTCIRAGAQHESLDKTSDIRAISAKDRTTFAFAVSGRSACCNASFSGGNTVRRCQETVFVDDFHGAPHNRCRTFYSNAAGL
jgi:hypothetical protein